MFRDVDWLAPFLKWQSWPVIAGNLLPLLGIVYLNWDASTLIILYWMETAIVGFWLVVRLSMADTDALPPVRMRTASTTIMDGPGMGLFLLVHAGIFMGIHMFLLTALAPGMWSRHLSSPMEFIYGFVIPAGVWIPLAGLFVARGALTIGDIRSKRKVGHLIAGFYLRIIVMQFVILLGGFIAAMLENPMLLLVLIVAFKIFVEIYWETFGARIEALFTGPSRKQPD